MATANPLPPQAEGIFDTIANLTPEDDAAIQRLKAIRGLYGQDFERELADFQAGRHPLQTRHG